MRFIALTTILPMLIPVSGFAAPQIGHALEAGDRAPGFSITTDHGSRISPGAFGHGLLVLNFWETSCVPCMRELPSLGEYERQRALFLEGKAIEPVACVVNG